MIWYWSWKIVPHQGWLERRIILPLIVSLWTAWFKFPLFVFIFTKWVFQHSVLLIKLLKSLAFLWNMLSWYRLLGCTFYEHDVLVVLWPSPSFINIYLSPCILFRNCFKGVNLFPYICGLTIKSDGTLPWSWCFLVSLPTTIVLRIFSWEVV